MIKEILGYCTASSQKWGVKELWDEFKRKGWNTAKAIEKPFIFVAINQK